MIQVTRLLSASSAISNRSCGGAIRSRSSLLTTTALAEHGQTRNNLPVAGFLASLTALGGLSLYARPNTQLDSSSATLDIAALRVDDNEEDADEHTTKVINWSGTHSVLVHNQNYWEPESIEEVEDIVRKCHENGMALRPIGSSLSPNGLALNAAGMIAMAGLDEIVSIDEDAMTVTAQAGVTVNQVVEALRPYGLTLPNLASIAEQQMGGFTQVGAHGTGRCIAPVDHYVTKLKMVTPGLGTIQLSKDTDGRLFELAKVGLGCLGVVVEVTMKCIPAHNLLEHTFVLTRREAKDQLDTLLKNHKHMRYMWIPYTDVVVVVTNDPESTVPSNIPRNQYQMTFEEAAMPLTELLKELTEGSSRQYSEEDMKGMGFGELRDALLGFGPLDMDHVKRCNQAEAEFWRRSQGYQTKPSDKLLQFDCGGQQWVLEVCFPTGTQDKNNGNDMEFMERLMAGIERQKMPAHSPIEQRWSASSSSLMSPAHGPSEGMHSWVGIINYLPTEDEKQRKEITDLFTGRYSDLVRVVGKPYQSVSHWAKLEHPKTIWRAVDLTLLMQNKYPLEDFNKARGQLDPKNILASPLINTALGLPEPPSDREG